MQPTRPRLGAALVVTLVAACAISLLSFGVRNAFGLLTTPLAGELQVPREVYSTALAIQNLCWGLAQPFAGYVSDRWGSRRVLVTGALLYLLGIAGMVFARDPLMLHATAGVLVGLGMGGASFTTAVAALGRLMPEAHRSWALGLGTAAGSLGQFVVVPLTQAVIDFGGWSSGAWFMAACMAAALLAAFFVGSGRSAAPAPAAAGAEGWRMLAVAFRHPSYLLLVAGFFVCGFQLAFITTHLPAYLVDRGSSAAVASWGLALVGLVNIAGSYLAGVWGGRYSKKNMLCAIYLARGLAIAWFVLAPASTAGVLLFGAAMGALWLTTVPLTSGLVATFFGPRYMATLFGFVFLSHQVGAFLGVYLGGAVFARTGSYDLVWGICIALSLFAALVNFPIREQASRPFAALSAA